MAFPVVYIVRMAILTPQGRGQIKCKLNSAIGNTTWSGENGLYSGIALSSQDKEQVNEMGF